MNKLNRLLKRYQKDGYVIIKKFLKKKEIHFFEDNLFKIY